MKNIFIIGLMLTLGACGVSLAKKDCTDANWFERGKFDGTDGKSFNLLSRYEKQCDKHKVKVDEKQYIAGYMAGLKIYCTEENGYNDGIRSAKIVGTCGEDSPYMKGYKKGYVIYAQDRERREAEEITRPDKDNGMRPGAQSEGG